jgi:hypothetical protein
MRDDGPLLRAHSCQTPSYRNNTSWNLREADCYRAPGATLPRIDRTLSLLDFPGVHSKRASTVTRSRSRSELCAPAQFALCTARIEPVPSRSVKD